MQKTAESAHCSELLKQAEQRLRDARNLAETALIEVESRLAATSVEDLGLARRCMNESSQNLDQATAAYKAIVENL